MMGARRLSASMSEGDPSLRQYLLQPGYWRPRLRKLASVPRKLVICPRPDLSRPGIEVLELRLQAHDRAPIRALLGRSAFARHGELVGVRVADSEVSDELDRAAIEAGRTDVLVLLSPRRRLEDRVLDVLRVVEACCSLESVDCDQVVLGPGPHARDELVVAGLLRDEGWLRTGVK